jgi:predicted amidohydrolase
MIIISTIQFKPRFATSRADVGSNIKELEPLIQDAYNRSSNFIVFPELCATGYSFLNKDDAWSVAENIDDPDSCPTYSFMRDVATQTGAYVAYGFPELRDGVLFNSAALFDPNGSMIGYCHKMNLFGNDFLWATSGEVNPPVVQTDIGRLAVIVCRDLKDNTPVNIPRAAAMKAILRGQKADIVAACANWGRGAFPSNVWMNFAYDNSCTLAVANRWGEEKNRTFEQHFGPGGSIIIEKDWTTHIDGLEFGKNCVVTAGVPDGD